MQIFVRSQETYVLELNGSETFDQVKELIALREGSEEVCLFASGKPLSEDGDLQTLENMTIDVTVPLKGGKVSVTRARTTC